MARLAITLACGDYDRTRALADGRVTVEGADLTVLALGPEEIFFRMVRFGEFDVAELSLSTYLLTVQQGAPFVAIPVFPSRAFRHSGIYVHSGAGIGSPRDLVGRRVGVAEYQLTANVWIRGILADFHDVPVSSVRYVTGGLHQSGRREKVAIPALPEGVEVTACPEGRTLAEMLVTGEIDALYTPRVPRPFLDGDPRVHRSSRTCARPRSYYRQTQIFPIMRRRHPAEVYERSRWLARSPVKGCTQARDLASAGSTDRRPAVRPALGLPGDRPRRALMGGDYWSYGLNPGQPDGAGHLPPLRPRAGLADDGIGQRTCSPRRPRRAGDPR
jgi:4,5-dihydroxyphthalate decarboxylase